VQLRRSHQAAFQLMSSGAECPLLALNGRSAHQLHFRFWVQSRHI